MRYRNCANVPAEGFISRFPFVQPFITSPVHVQPFEFDFATGRRLSNNRPVERSARTTSGYTATGRPNLHRESERVRSRCGDTGMVEHRAARKASQIGRVF